MDAKRDSFYPNAKERFGFDDCAYVTVTTDNQGLRGDGCRAPDTPGKPYFTAPGNLTWALHDYYLHYRYTMNHELVTDQRFVRPNTMYIEGDPVLECSTFVNNAVQDMLIQSWGNTIRVFHAIPTAIIPSARA